MSVNSKMTAIADKIRTLRGTSGTMGLDAMAAHLGSEQSAITAALAALAEKGVDVPAGSTSDALAELIAGIEAGGGGEDLIKKEGSITPTTQSQTITITHGLGKVPKFFIGRSSDQAIASSGSANQFIVLFGWAYDITVMSRGRYSAGYKSSASVEKKESNGYILSSIDEQTITFTITSYYGSNFLFNSSTYYWKACG